MDKPDLEEIADLNEEVRKHNEEFMRNTHKAHQAWHLSHPGQRPPVSQDKDGRLFWLNRKARRKMMKGGAR